jgi:hypothetical protein
VGLDGFSSSNSSEGLGKLQKDQSCPESHFEIFLTMYKEYLDIENATANFDWLPIRRVPINPINCYHFIIILMQNKKKGTGYIEMDGKRPMSFFFNVFRNGF